MGSRMNFELFVESGEVDLEDILFWLKVNTVYEHEFYIYEDRVVLEDERWDSHERDLFRLSMAFPCVLFCLRGTGEDPGDLWDHYWQNGDAQLCMAEIPPYDPLKMEFRADLRAEIEKEEEEFELPF